MSTFFAAADTNLSLLRRRHRLHWLLAFAVVFLTLPHVSNAHSAPITAEWRDVGTISSRGYCIDPTRPNTIISGSDYGPTVSYNWETKQSQQLHNGVLVACSPQGILFSELPAPGPVVATTVWRFTTQDPTPVQVEHRPTHFSSDASLQMYALDHGLFASADGGLTWEQRGAEFNFHLVSIAVSASDAQSIAALTVNRDPSGVKDLTVYFSTNGGRTWERRFQQELRIRASLEPLHGFAVPSDAFMLSIISENLRPTQLVTLDGGRSFAPVQTPDDPQHTAVIYNQGWLVRLRPGSAAARTTLDRSHDGGVTWEVLPTPNAELNEPFFVINSQTPMLAGILIDDATGIWYSSDVGQTWQKWADGRSTRPAGPVVMTSYLPAALLIAADLSPHGPYHLFVLSLADEGSMYTAPVNRQNDRAAVFFPETGHYLAGPFQRYWEDHGGLAQFGYPRTEILRELNPADGKVYLVQYFERNRFEYHPELVGTPHEVLLGLLGSQFTSDRRAEVPFQRVDDPALADQRYFFETGHTLGGRFLDYWEQRGGLAIYGYPISQEFQEVNADTGQPYTVQYFERARFEYHPEHQGTVYEVELGLLGNTLLHEKGWLAP